MATMKEILLGKDFDSLNSEQKSNLVILLNSINKFLVFWGKPVTYTNCVRTMQEHLNIYAKKGITDPKKIPMKSKHLIGAAIDIADNGLVITKWLKDNPKVMDDCDIYCEEGNSNWLHIQIIPFKSYKVGGTRWFNP